MTAATVDRRRRRSRTALLQAAEALFAMHGVDAVTIDDIVGAADLAKGTFYNHFPDKEALVAAVASVIRGQLEAAIEVVNAGVSDPARRVARAVALYLQLQQEAPVRASALRRLPVGALDPAAPLNAGVRRDVGDGLREGRFAAMPLEVSVAAILGVASAASALRKGRSSANARAHAEAVIALILRALGVAGGEAVEISTEEVRSIFAQQRFC